MLRLARICTAGLGLTAILVAVVWSDIIGLLLFTYHVWAPAIILPVTVGAIYKKRSKKLTQNIFVTMLGATIITLLYRFFGWLYASFNINLFGETVYKFIDQFDPAVFGVSASCIIFLIMVLFNRGVDEPG